MPEEDIDLPDGWHARTPVLEDVAALVALRAMDQERFTGSGRVDVAAVESEVAGEASWTRQQVVAVRADDVPRAWLAVHDRAAGRALVWGWFDRSVGEVDAIAGAFYGWAEEQAVAMARLREVEETRLDDSPFADDEQQAHWLEAAGYAKRRTWLHMSRAVRAEDAGLEPRGGVTIRPVAVHENGMPVAGDLQVVHRMLEESFEDHFNSYRESFPEFVQRLREDPGHRWDHWWLAYVDPGDGTATPAGTVVCSVLAPDEDGVEGSYVEYIGVDRHARGRGVAKSLLAAVFADAAERGRNRVNLEVDADSPTNADELYVSLGFETEYVTDSWFKDLRVV